AVFAELAGRPAPLADAVVWFTHNFRFGAGSAIGRLAADINAGRAAAALDGLRAGGDARWIDDAGAAPAPETWRCIEDGLAPYLATVLRDPSDPGAVTEAFGTSRVLCAVHEGPRGMLAVDAHASRHARAVLAPLAARHVVAGSDWYPGRPVMVLRNDPVQRLYNGDIGIALPDAAGELKVFFPDAGGGFRAVAPLRLPEHRSAFAMTVHKSQGSEFDDVLVLLPAERSRVLTRELLYTAVTRARRSVTLAGGAPVVEAAIAAPTQRVSGLLARLRDEA
ncbi:MAG: ATP-binding domain-containing protein, partial [Betaproteobacteria bacterium]